MSQPLDDYLSRVARELRSLPSAARENELREVRSHLEQLIDDGVSAGQSRDVATQRALNTFGSARAVGIGVRDVWEGQDFGWKPVLRALFCGFAFLMSVVFAAIEFALYFPSPHSEWFRSLKENFLPIALFLLVPFSMGIIFSIYTKRRAWIINLAFFGFLLPCLIIVPCNSGSSLRDIWINNFWILLVVFPAVVLGFLGTVTGNAVARRRRNAKWALVNGDLSVSSKQDSPSRRTTRKK